jgi:hypothetical protein
MKGYRKASVIIGESSEDWREDDESVAVGNGLRFASELASAGGTVWLVMSTLTELNRHRGLRDTLGLGEAGILASRGALPYDGQTIRHASRETIHSRGVEGSILTVFPRPELLAALDDLDEPHTLVVVPGIRRDVAAWINAWGRTTLPPINLIRS